MQWILHVGLISSSKSERWTYVTSKQALVRGIRVQLYNDYNCLWLMDLMLGIIPFYAKIIVRIPSKLQLGFGYEPRLNIGNSVLCASARLWVHWLVEFIERLLSDTEKNCKNREMHVVPKFISYFENFQTCNGIPQVWHVQHNLTFTVFHNNPNTYVPLGSNDNSFARYYPHLKVEAHYSKLIPYSIRLFPFSNKYRRVEISHKLWHNFLMHQPRKVGNK